MSQFTVPLAIIPAHDGKTAKVLGEFEYDWCVLGSNEYIRVEDGMETDGTSLPIGLEFLLRGFVDRWAYAKAVFVHDKACVVLRVELKTPDPITGRLWRELERLEIDREFKTALLALGCPKFKAHTYYLGVRIWFYWKGRK